MSKIIIADNQDITHAGVFYLCRSMESVSSIDEVSCSQELIRLLVAYPDAIVILDHTLFDFRDIGELFLSQEQYQKVHWVLFSREFTDDIVQRIRKRDKGFSLVYKSCKISELTQAISEAICGRQYLCHVIKWHTDAFEHAKEHLPALLTSTEMQILQAIVYGKTTRQIANDRGSSLHTIYTHRKNIFRKLQVNSVHDMIRYALRQGLVDAIEYYI